MSAIDWLIALLGIGCLVFLLYNGWVIIRASDREVALCEEEIRLCEEELAKGSSE